MPEETVGAAELATCECEPCKRGKGQPHNVQSRIIHRYESTPRNGWTPRRTRAEVAAGITAATFGVELETSVTTAERIRDLPGEPRVTASRWPSGEYETALLLEQQAAVTAWRLRNEAHLVQVARGRARMRNRMPDALSAEEAVSMAAPRGLWHSKHDGSVSGPEFASQPATLAYWRSVQPHLIGMFKALLHGGIRSHDGDTCGMHVNIGTDAFGGIEVPHMRGVFRSPTRAEHIDRFATLIAANQRWTMRLSQRTHVSMMAWARFDELDSPVKRTNWADSIARHGYAYGSHSVVLNGGHTGRIEFRLPRGTLRFDRFMAKLEWTAAMVEFTRNPDNVVQPSAFMRWVAAGGEYPQLLAFMRERFNAARFGETE